MASNDIRVSLELLAETVQNLEKEIIAKENAPKPALNQMPPQHDLFGSWMVKPANDKNTALLAKKLDSTIDKVQQLLKEAGA